MHFHTYRKFKNIHERSEAGNPGIPLRKIWVLCSDDAADRCFGPATREIKSARTVLIKSLEFQLFTSTILAVFFITVE